MGQKQSYGVNEESASAAVEKEGCVATSVDATCTPSKVTKLSPKVINTNTDTQLASAPIHVSVFSTDVEIAITKSKQHANESICWILCRADNE